MDMIIQYIYIANGLIQHTYIANISNNKHTMVSSIHTYIGSKFDIVHRTKSKQEGSIKRRVDSINASFLI